MSASEEVRAAGGVVWRRCDTGIEMVLVHRPAYDDWSLPKGKLHPGEADSEAALREVEEETSLTCKLGPELASVAYLDALGRSKGVRYWAMTVSHGTVEGANEVDAAVWIGLEEGRSRLTHERDTEVVDSFLELVEAGVI